VNSAETIERVPFTLTPTRRACRWYAGDARHHCRGSTLVRPPRRLPSSTPPFPWRTCYSVITYYLRHKTEVSVYLHRRQEQAATIREEVERRFPPSTSGTTDGRRR